MMAILRWIVGLVVVIVVAVFALLNRGVFNFYWSPFPADDPVALPVYIIVLGAMAVGFVLGALMVWFNESSARSEKRRQKKEIKILQKEVGVLKEERFSAPAQELFPALPVRGKS